MKQKLLNKFWLRVGMIVAVMTTALAGTVKADEVVAYTLTPASGSNNGYANNCDIEINGITWNLTGNSTIQPWRIGGKSLNGVDRTLYSKTAITDNVSKIEVTHGAASSITVNSWIVIVSKNSDFSSPVSTLTPTFAASSTTTINRPDGVDWSNCYYKFVYNVSVSGDKNKFVEFAGAKFYTQSAASYTITAASNNNDWGTVSLSGNVITAVPATGYTYADPAYTVTGTATVSQNGNEFTVSASSDCTVTINFMAKPTVSGYNVDFENELEAYTDWTFTNAEQGTGDITAHGGTYYATTGGKASASFETKEPIALPGTFTCYVSKTSNNTTSSTWTVEVSSDGSDWTAVETQDATSMTKGSWTEFTANLSLYSNVYVRLTYSGSTAVRTVDDISITMRDPNAKITPTVTIDDTGITTTDIAGNTNVAAGTLAATVTSGETTITTPAVTWSSSDTGVATVNATTGAVTLIAVGTTTITATFAGNDDYTEASATYELTVIDSYAKGQLNNPYTVAEALAVIDGLADNAYTATEVYVSGIISEINSQSSQYASARYYISDDGTTTIQLYVYNGKYLNNVNFTEDNQIKVNDQVVVYGKLQKYVKNSTVTPEIAAGNYIYSLQRPTGAPTVNIGTQTNVASVEMWIGDNDLIDIVDGAEVEEGVEVFVQPTAADGYEIESVTVVDADNNSVTVTENTGNWSFVMPNSSVTINITAVQGSVTPTGDKYVKVTSTADLTDGQYLIVYETDGVAFNGGLETLDAGNNVISVAISNGEIAATEATAAAEFTIDVTEGTILSASGKYIGVSSNNNGLKQTEDASTYTNSFSIDDDGNAVISAVFEGSTMSLRFNSASGDSNYRFRYYKNAGQQAIQLYKFVEATTPEPYTPETITLNGSGYATFASTSAVDFTNAETNGYSAWQVTGVDASGVITCVQITDAVAAGTGVLLKGTASDQVTIEYTTSGATLSDNKLEGVVAPKAIEFGQYYGLKGNTFVKVNTGTVPAGKALLPATAVNGEVKAFTFNFDEDATAIKAIENGQLTTDGVIYNVAGQRLSKMQKGINIVNGKKILK